MNPLRGAIVATLFCSLNTLPAAIIGTNTAAQPLTLTRVGALPAWRAYLGKSIHQRQTDQALIKAELRAYHLQTAIEPAISASPKGTPLNRPADWYGSAEARRIAGCVVSYQTPAGGWSKHTDFTQHIRQPGELFAGNSNSRFLITNDLDQPTDVHWSYVGTFDNGATTTEMRYLAKVIAAGGTNTATLISAFERGLDYIFNAQFPNGGWPQVWPLQGGYHDAITYNDGAMLRVIQLLRDLALGQNEFAFVSPALRARAATSWKHGLDCLLATQIITSGQRTVWCQQHDALTLQPTSARNYEMPSECSSESSDIVLFLMQLPDPDSRVITAVHAAVAWFEKTKIEGKAFKRDGADGRKLMDAPDNGPIWARYYELGSEQPIYGDRDRTIHDDVNEISRERRTGYGWFTDAGKRVLQNYPAWAKQHPLTP